MNKNPDGRDIHIGFCETCDKRLYANRDDARRARRRMPSRQGLRAYPCPEISEFFHLGRKPQAVQLGIRTASEIYRRAS